MRLTSWISAGLVSAGLAAWAGDGDLFDQLDSSGDGQIEKSEVGEEQTRFFERLLRVGDADKDGVLTKSEFDTALNDEPSDSDADRAPGQRPKRGAEGRSEKRPGESRPGGRGKMPSVDQVIERLDKNGDGKVQRDELGDEQGRGRALIRMMDSLDTDELTREQLEEGRQRMMERMRDARGERPMDGDKADGERGPKGKKGARDKGKNQKGPGARGEKGRRDEMGPPEGERRPEMERGPRGERGPRPGDRRGPRGEGDRERRPPAFLRTIDANEDGQISKDEAAALADKFDELDHNGDGMLDMPELMGFPGRGPEGGMRGRGRGGDGPEGRGPRGPGKGKPGSGSRSNGPPERDTV